MKPNLGALRRLRRWTRSWRTSTPCPRRPSLPLASRWLASAPACAPRPPAAPASPPPPSSPRRRRAPRCPPLACHRPALVRRSAPPASALAPPRAACRPSRPPCRCPLAHHGAAVPAPAESGGSSGEPSPTSPPPSRQGPSWGPGGAEEWYRRPGARWSPFGAAQTRQRRASIALPRRGAALSVLVRRSWHGQPPLVRLLAFPDRDPGLTTDAVLLGLLGLSKGRSRLAAYPQPPRSHSVEY